jgi:hypothetical protein
MFHMNSQIIQPHKRLLSYPPRKADNLYQHLSFSISAELPKLILQ